MMLILAAIVYILIFINYSESQFDKLKVDLINKIIYSPQKYNIFFVESNIKRGQFSTKQMCAIESAARNNPNSYVQVYTLKARLTQNTSFLVTKYSNIQIIEFNANQTLANDSNLLEFWNKGDAMKSQYASEHLSDFLRFIFFNSFKVYQNDKFRMKF